ncbi:MAG: hypothetical protein LBT52_04480, partial [Clostridiales Family XIII bacterium]|nr:hypothetical protein [Clostridiales Family XIII bacterium]
MRKTNKANKKARLSRIVTQKTEDMQAANTQKTEDPQAANTQAANTQKTAGTKTSVMQKTAGAARKIFRRRKPGEPVRHGKIYRRLDALYSHPFFGNQPLCSGVLALISLLIIEGFGYEDPFGGFLFFAKNPFAFFLNFLIIFATLSISWICRRRWFAQSGLMLIWIVLGVTNGVVLTTRMTPFTVADFEIMDLGIEMFAVYLTTTQTVLVFAAAVVAVVVFALLFLKAPKLKPWGGWKKFLTALASVVVVFVLLLSCWNIGTQTGLVASYFT